MNVVLPSIADLQPLLEKLEREPDGVCMIALTRDPVATDFANAGWQFFDQEERAALKACLLRLRAKRAKREAKP